MTGSLDRLYAAPEISTVVRAEKRTCQTYETINHVTTRSWSCCYTVHSFRAQATGGGMPVSILRAIPSSSTSTSVRTASIFRNQCRWLTESVTVKKHCHYNGAIVFRAVDSTLPASRVSPTPINLLICPATKIPFSCHIPCLREIFYSMKFFVTFFLDQSGGSSFHQDAVVTRRSVRDRRATRSRHPLQLRHG